MKITLPDNSTRELPEGSSGYDLAKDIGPGLAKSAVAVIVDGEQKDLHDVIEGDSLISIITIDSDNAQIEHDALSSEQRYLQIKVRASELALVLKEGKPWEDLSIGFQCRIYRQPNIYNSDFWFYFTNIYATHISKIPILFFYMHHSSYTFHVVHNSSKSR